MSLDRLCHSPTINEGAHCLGYNSIFKVQTKVITSVFVSKDLFMSLPINLEWKVCVCACRILLNPFCVYMAPIVHAWIITQACTYNYACITTHHEYQEPNLIWEFTRLFQHACEKRLDSRLQSVCLVLARCCNSSLGW